MYTCICITYWMYMTKMYAAATNQFVRIGAALALRLPSQASRRRATSVWEQNTPFTQTVTLPHTAAETAVQPLNWRSAS